MMADVNFKLEGLEELLGKLESVTYDMKYKGGRFALRKAAQVIREKAKANAQRLDDPETAKNTAANIVERWDGKMFRATGNLGFRVGVMGGAGGSRKAEALAGLPGGDTRTWRHLEFGTSKTAAQPFMRTALSENISEATSEFVRQYEKALDRAIRKSAKAAK